MERGGKTRSASASGSLCVCRHSRGQQMRTSDVCLDIAASMELAVPGRGTKHHDNSVGVIPRGGLGGNRALRAHRLATGKWCLEKQGGIPDSARFTSSGIRRPLYPQRHPEFGRTHLRSNTKVAVCWHTVAPWETRSNRKEEKQSTSKKERVVGLRKGVETDLF